jgi:hypothetical protein
LSELWQHTKLIRSKNAGPFQLTFDIMFKTRESLEKVRNCGIISPASISTLYKVPTDKVKFFGVDEVNAIRITIPPPVFSGDLDDSDMYGAPFHSPLVLLQIPD